MVGRGFPSGQRGGTQDPVVQASEGSNPSLRTFILSSRPDNRAILLARAISQTLELFSPNSLAVSTNFLSKYSDIVPLFPPFFIYT